jgi:hypothetical protein
MTSQCGPYQPLPVIPSISFYGTLISPMYSCVVLFSYEYLASAIIHNISYMIVAAIRAVLPDESKGGETSTISAPMIFSPPP